MATMQTTTTTINEAAPTTSNDQPTNEAQMDWSDAHHEAAPTTSNATKRPHSDEEEATPKRPMTNATKMTYADKTKTSQATPQGTPQAEQQPPQQVRLNSTHADRHRRTLILRRLPYLTNTENIITALQEEFNLDEPEQYIDAILRDKDDRRRFYVTFHRYEDKRNVAEKGFRIGDFLIPAQTGDVSGLIPYPTYYITETDIHKLLEPYGDNIRGNFRRDQHGIRTGGYNFTMDLKPGQTLPKTVTLYNETLNVFNKDDKRLCTYCHRHGHTRQYCKQLQQQRNTQQQNQAEHDSHTLVSQLLNDNTMETDSNMNTGNTTEAHTSTLQNAAEQTKQDQALPDTTELRNGVEAPPELVISGRSSTTRTGSMPKDYPPNTENTQTNTKTYAQKTVQTKQSTPQTTTANDKGQTPTGSPRPNITFEKTTPQVETPTKEEQPITIPPPQLIDAKYKPTFLPPTINFTDRRPFVNLITRHYIQHEKNGEKTMNPEDPTTIYVKTRMPKEYIDLERLDMRASTILKNYFMQLDEYKNLTLEDFENDPFGVIVDEDISNDIIEFYVDNTTWGSPRHIHLLTAVKLLIYPDVDKVMTTKNKVYKIHDFLYTEKK